MKKTKYFGMFITFLVILVLCIGMFSATALAATTSLNNDTQIGGFDATNKLIFFANVLPDRATPFAIGPTIINSSTPGPWGTAPGTDVDYSYFFNTSSPNFSVIYSTSDDAANSTTVSGTNIPIGSLAGSMTKIEKTTTTARYQYSANPDIDINSSFRIVKGMTAEDDVLRIEYMVTNKSTNTLYVGGRMHGDTLLGSSAKRTDNALVIVDNANQFVNSPSNSQGFLYDGGEVKTMCRFVDRADNDGTFINGLPRAWRNVMQFNDQNPVTSYFSVTPDVQSTASHFYPTPNVLDFSRWSSVTAPTGGYPSNAMWIPLSQQKSGQTTEGSPSGARNVVAFGSGQSINSDSQTSLQWNKMAVAPGQSVSYVYFIGRDITKMNSTGSLASLLSVSPSARFGIINGDIQNITAALRMQNTNTTTPITNMAVKFVYDETKIKLLDSTGVTLPKTGDINTTLNGVAGTYAYYLVNPADIAARAFSNVDFILQGINLSVNDISTYIKTITDFTDYSGPQTAESENIKLTIPGIFEEDKSPGYLKVKHVVQGSNEVILEYDMAGIVGDTATSHAMDFVNYALAPGQEASRTGPLLKKTNPLYGSSTQVYEYVPSPNTYNLGGVIVQHIGVGEDNYEILLAMEHLHGPLGTSYEVSNKPWPGYKFTAEPPITGQYTATPLVVKFYYDYDASNPEGFLDVHRNAGRVLVEYRDKSTDALITRDTIMANISLPEYEKTLTVNAIDINSYMLADSATKQVTVASGGTATVPFYYLQPGYVKVTHWGNQGSGSPVLLLEEYAIGPVGTQAVVSSKDFTSYRFANGQNRVNTDNHFTATLPGPVPEVQFFYNKNPGIAAGDILIKHVDKDNPMNVLFVEHVHGMVETNYTATSKNIIGYYPAIDPQTVTTPFGPEPQVIEFRYPYNNTDLYNINTIPLHTGKVFVEHRDLDTNALIARDTILADIAEGATQKDVTAMAGTFRYYDIVGANSQTVSVGNGEEKTVIFRYKFNHIENTEKNYRVIFLDEALNQVGPEGSYKGTPGALVDFTKITIPSGYLLADENEVLRAPVNPNEPIYVHLIQQKPDSPKADLLIKFKDVRGFEIAGLTPITGLSQAEPAANAELVAVPESSASAAPSSTVKPSASVAPSPTVQPSASAVPSPTVEPSPSAAPSPTAEPVPSPTADDSEGSAMATADASSLFFATSVSRVAQDAQQLSKREVDSSAMPTATVPASETQAPETSSAPSASAVAPTSEVSPTASALSPEASTQEQQISTNLSVEYNLKIENVFAGSAYDLNTNSIITTPPLSAYAFHAPSTGRILFYNREIIPAPPGSSYVFKTVLMHPKMVTLKVSIQDTQGGSIGSLDHQVPWNQYIGIDNVGDFLGQYAQGHTIVNMTDKNGSNQPFYLNETGPFDQNGAYPVTVTLLMGATPTPSPTPTPTPTPSQTAKPTPSQTAKPTPRPTVKPTPSQTVNPTGIPTTNPTVNPTTNPTANPTTRPTSKPTSNPTTRPTSNPTGSPTVRPLASPSASSLVSPSASPTVEATNSPEPVVSGSVNDENNGNGDGDGGDGAGSDMDTTSELLRQQTLDQLKTEGVPMLQIGNATVPLFAGTSKNVWSLFNLLITLAGIGTAIVVTVQNRKTTERNKKLRLRWISVIAGLVPIILFFATQNLQNLMVLFDGWSVLFSIILGVQIVLAVLGKQKKDSNEISK